MKTYSIYETKAKLSQVIKMVTSGQEVIITDRGTPVARICPLEDKDDLTAKLSNLAKQGRLEPRQHQEYGALPVKKNDIVQRFLKERE